MARAGSNITSGKTEDMKAEFFWEKTTGTGHAIFRYMQKHFGTCGEKWTI